MTPRLRQALVTDLPLVYRGELDYMRCWEPDHEGPWRLHLEQNLTQWVENFDCLTVATIDDQFAGYALWIPEQDFAVLCTISVSQAYRRNGIGRALLDDYVVSAKRKGFIHLRLSVRADNPARLMYEQAGFVRVGIDSNDYLRYELRS